MRKQSEAEWLAKWLDHFTERFGSHWNTHDLKARRLLAALRRRGWREPVKKKGAKQMAITTGQMPAFPVNLPGWGDNGASGMTLRDYFAGQALIALFAASAHPEHIGISESYYKDTGIECYKIADALISAKESMP